MSPASTFLPIPALYQKRAEAMNALATKASPRGGKTKRTTGRRDQDESRSVTCPSCGGRAPIGARYCQGCGASLDGASWLTPQTLTVLAAAGIALVALGFLFASVINVEQAPPVSSTVTAAPRPAPSGQPPDLSTMSPREAADRLFNRVMTADERGDADVVQQFAPMALSAYDMLENLDTDALYHVGLIQAAAGNLDRARDYTDQLTTIVPDHLLAIILEHRLATQENDQAAASRAIEQFQSRYDDEIAVDRPEYQHHRPSIEKFRDEINGRNGDDG